MTDPVPAAPTAPEPTEAAPARRFEDLPPAAQRALKEAEARRAEAEAEAAAAPREVNGRGGLEPVRYGDWEIKGLTADF
ncbi:DUF1674 domain-containing protein [Chthonobacter rhizosphaerae]|uniref:DUF1674 domain-containing protein n=1 Tax=Chthonobacter rhizosphaerae TaxID=2735553 RepID=UPI0015EF9C1F|nr:DUF1674 domain-containing protein [Chthonobacter rhizosphaerae]